MASRHTLRSQALRVSTVSISSRAAQYFTSCRDVCASAATSACVARPDRSISTAAARRIAWVFIAWSLVLRSRGHRADHDDRPAGPRLPGNRSIVTSVKPVILQPDTCAECRPMAGSLATRPIRQQSRRGLSLTFITRSIPGLLSASASLGAGTGDGALPKKPANARAETKSSPHRGRRPRGHLSKCTVVRSEIEFINPTAKALSLGCRKFVVKERKVIAHEFASTERYEFATGVLAARSARCHRLASSAE